MSEDNLNHFFILMLQQSLQEGHIEDVRHLHSNICRIVNKAHAIKGIYGYAL
jgi:hypothetical protein